MIHTHQLMVEVDVMLRLLPPYPATHSHHHHERGKETEIEGVVVEDGPVLIGLVSSLSISLLDIAVITCFVIEVVYYYFM